jgi:hypothetical protein
MGNFKNYEETLSDGTKVVMLGFTEDWKNIALKMLENGTDGFGHYSLEDTDPETVNIWISDAFGEGEDEYAHALQDGLAQDAYIFTLDNGIGDFRQTLGEVIVY